MTGAESASPALTIRLLGPLELLRRGTPLPRLRTRKGHWLLALLVLRQGCEVERSWLAGLLWPNSSESEANASLRVSLSHLRAALGPEAARLRSLSPHTLCLDLGGVEVDVAAFDAAIARGDEASLKEAIALYRGPLLEGCTEEWAFQERQIREQTYLQALETVAASAMARGDPDAAAGYLGRAAAVDPLRESAQRGLMQALAAAGNYAAALLSYRELRLRLHRELNAEPDPETQVLFQQLRAQARSGEGVKGRRGEGVKERTGAGPEASVVSLEHPLTPSPFHPFTPSPLHPSGTITFLLTDVEGSTRLWQQNPEAMRLALARHDALAAAIIEQHDGLLVKQRGEEDSLFAVFARATDAVTAALELQGALTREAWPVEGQPQGLPLRVRAALHTGQAERREGDYFGLAVNHCARLRAVGHGGQTLLCQTTAALVRDNLPAGAALRELGAHRLKDLQRPEPIFQLVHPELPAAFPPLRSLEAFAHNLPVQLTSFVGREQEIAAVQRLLPTTHLLTLTGAGGCGKTRLALQVAADLVEEYRDGVWLVELASLAEAGLVPHSVAAALGVREEPNRPLTATLADSLRPRALLLVLDNCEHLLPACASLAEALLRSCPALRILATSREGLGIDGERTHRVPSLSLPPVAPTFQSATAPSGSSALLEYEAVRLFVERAEFAQPRFAVTDQNARAVAQVCQRLDGIPLAIELAAARVKALPVETLNERLDDMFRLLTGGSRSALPRHQTLRALIDWSYDLSSPPEQTLLRRFSVFAGGWTLEAAEAVCDDFGFGVVDSGLPAKAAVSDGRTSLSEPIQSPKSKIQNEEVLDLLTSLVEKSLVLYEERGSEARYRLLETVRQYARERLGEVDEAEAVRRRHAEYFLQLAERAEPELRRPEQGRWLDRLQKEHDNLRAALTWLGSAEGRAHVPQAQDPLRGYPTGPALRAPVLPSAWGQLRLAGALWRFYFSRGYYREGRQWTEAALSRAPDAPAPVRVKALRAAGDLARFMGDFAAADRLLEESIARARAAGQKGEAALALFHWALLAISQKEYARGSERAQECLSLAGEVGDPWLRALSLAPLGLAALHQGDLVSARSFFDEHLALGRSLGDKVSVARATMHLGTMALSRGEREEARALYREGLMRGQELADTPAIAASLSGLAAAAAPTQPERAARLFGAVEALREAMGSALAPFDHGGYDDHVAAARAQLDAETFAAAWAEGRTMPLEQAIALALEEADDA